MTSGLLEIITMLSSVLTLMLLLGFLSTYQNTENNSPKQIEQYGQTYVLQTEVLPTTIEINGHTYVLQD